MQHTQADVKRILKQSLPPKRPKHYDGLPSDDLNSLDGMFFRSKKARIEVHVVPWQAGLDELEFIAEHLHSLILEVELAPTDRAKSIMIRDTIQHWTRSFARRGKE